MAKDFTIVIAHRGNGIGLWATVQSCEIELADQGFDYDYVIVENGVYHNKLNHKTGLYEDLPVFDVDFQNTILELDRDGKLKQKLTHPKPMCPPSARQIGTKFATGKYIFFFDNHCLVTKDYFRRAILDFETYGCDVLHSSYRYYHGQFTHYEYKLQLGKNFWGEATTFPQNEVKPYRIAMSGHGGFMVTREVWEAVGGYWDGFVGYGGEEPYFDLKCWQLGYQVWVDPKIIHYHYAGDRGYRRHYTDEFFVNMMAVANIIGGQSWLEKVGFNFLKNYPKSRTSYDMFDLQMIAQKRSQPHADYLSSVRKMDLEELMEHFRANLIAR